MLQGLELLCPKPQLPCIVVIVPLTPDVPPRPLNVNKTSSAKIELEVRTSALVYTDHLMNSAQDRHRASFLIAISSRACRGVPVGQLPPDPLLASRVPCINGRASETGPMSDRDRHPSGEESSLYSSNLR